MPLAKNNADSRSTQNPLLAKLIYLVNTNVMVSFMGKLFNVLAGEVFSVYADRKGLLKFEKFMEFARDHDIFPKVVTKAALFTIFSSLAQLNETLNS